MPETAVKAYADWVWRPLRPAGLLHLVPPQPGPLATTACWRPLTEVARSSSDLVTGERCTRCDTRQDPA